MIAVIQAHLIRGARCREQLALCLAQEAQASPCGDVSNAAVQGASADLAGPRVCAASMRLVAGKKGHSSLKTLNLGGFTHCA